MPPASGVEDTLFVGEALKIRDLGVEVAVDIRADLSAATWSRYSSM